MLIERHLSRGSRRPQSELRTESTPKLRPSARQDSFGSERYEPFEIAQVHTQSCCSFKKIEQVPKLTKKQADQIANRLHQAAQRKLQTIEKMRKQRDEELMSEVKPKPQICKRSEALVQQAKLRENQQQHKNERAEHKFDPDAAISVNMFTRPDSPRGSFEEAETQSRSQIESRMIDKIL